MTFDISDSLRKYLGWCPKAHAIPISMQSMKRVEETGPGIPGDSPAGGNTGWIGHHGPAAVAITSSLCLIALTVVLKNILLVPTEDLNRDIVLYIVIYLGFIVSFLPVKDQADPEMPGLWPLIWCAIIVIITLAIMGVYAI